MTETYELCTRDSQTLLHHQLATTDFADKFNYKPYRHFNHKGDRVWSNLMSGDWAWKEAVRFYLCHHILCHSFSHFRIPLLLIRGHMALSWSQSYLEVTRRQCLLQPVIRNTTLFINPQVIWPILLIAGMEMEFSLLLFFPFQKVHTGLLHLSS